MSRPSMFDEIERRTGRSMADVLIDLYDEFGDITQVAAYLRVSDAAIRQWAKKCGLKQKTILVFADDAGVRSAFAERLAEAIDEMVIVTMGAINSLRSDPDQGLTKKLDMIRDACLRAVGVADEYYESRERARATER